MNKLFTTPDSTLPTIRKASRIGDKSRIGRPQADMVALAQATKAHYEKQGVTHYAKLSSGKIIKTSFNRQTIIDHIRQWNQ